MRIAFHSHSPNLAGAERMMLNLATSLARGGVAECLIAVHGEGAMLSAALPRHCRFHRLAAPSPWYLFAPVADAPGPYFQAQEQAATELADVLRDWGAEILVANTLTSLTGTLAAARLNLPTVAWVHGIIDQQLLPHSTSWYRVACDEAVLRSAARVVCPSRWTAVHFENRFGVPAQIIPNATVIPDRVVPPPAGDMTTFCCLNTWEENKGILTLLDAVLLLKQHSTRFRLELYGAGSPGMTATMRSRIAALGLDDVVHLMGPTTDPGAVYYRSHALVTASQVESFGMTLIEAMGHGRPVIVSDTSGHREIVTGPFGVRLPTGDAAAFAWQMRSVIVQPEKARKMGALGRAEAVAKYGTDRLTTAFADVFREVLDAERSLSPQALARRYAPCRPFMALAS